MSDYQTPLGYDEYSGGMTPTGTDTPEVAETGLPSPSVDRREADYGLTGYEDSRPYLYVNGIPGIFQPLAASPPPLERRSPIRRIPGTRPNFPPPMECSDLPDLELSDYETASVYDPETWGMTPHGRDKRNPLERGLRYPFSIEYCNYFEDGKCGKPPAFLSRSLPVIQPDYPSHTERREWHSMLIDSKPSRRFDQDTTRALPFATSMQNLLKPVYFYDHMRRSRPRPRYPHFVSTGMPSTRRFPQHGGTGRSRPRRFPQHGAGGRSRPRRFQQHGGGGRSRPRRFPPHGAEGMSRPRRFPQHGAHGMPRPRRFPQHGADGMSRPRRFPQPGWAGKSRPRRFPQHGADGMSQPRRFPHSGWGGRSRPRRF